MDTVLLTVLYADIFNYPLTYEELRRWMLFEDVTKVRKKKYYFLPGRDNLVAIRHEREKWQPEKWDIARRAAKYLSHIPMVRLVGVTGGLAMNNARREDDIDLFLITSDGWLWTSRLLATMLLDLLRLRRHPNDKSVTNKVCLNMFVTEKGLAVAEKDRDLFSAHEVLQMQPLFSRNTIYKRFLRANVWVKKFLPNAWRYRSDH